MSDDPAKDQRRQKHRNDGQTLGLPSDLYHLRSLRAGGNSQRWDCQDPNIHTSRLAFLAEQDLHTHTVQSVQTAAESTRTCRGHFVTASILSFKLEVTIMSTSRRENFSANALAC